MLILAGLLYIFGSEMSFIAERGIADVQMFNPKDFPLFIGCVSPLESVDERLKNGHRTAVLSFEGVGLVNYFSMLERRGVNGGLG